MEWLEHAGKRDRAAIGVCDDAVVLERSAAVHLRHDERNARLEPVGRGLVDDRRPAAHRVRHELARGARTDREEEDVDVPALERLGCRLLDDLPAQLLAGGARGGEHAHVLIAAFAEQTERHVADRAGAADDADASLAVHPQKRSGARVNRRVGRRAARARTRSASPAIAASRVGGEATRRQKRCEWFASRRWQSSWTTT